VVASGQRYGGERNYAADDQSICTINRPTGGLKRASGRGKREGDITDPGLKFRHQEMLISGAPVEQVEVLTDSCEKGVGNREEGSVPVKPPIA